MNKALSGCQKQKVSIFAIIARQELSAAIFARPELRARMAFFR
jgi:hypothetical protein